MGVCVPGSECASCEWSSVAVMMVFKLIITSHSFLINNEDNGVESAFIAPQIEGPRLSNLTIRCG